MALGGLEPYLGMGGTVSSGDARRGLSLISLGHGSCRWLTRTQLFPVAGMKFRQVFGGMRVLRKLVVAPHLDSSLSHGRVKLRLVYGGMELVGEPPVAPHLYPSLSHHRDEVQAGF